MEFYVCDFVIGKSVTYCKRSDYRCLCTDKNAMATYAGCLVYGNRNTTGSLKTFSDTCLQKGMLLFLMIGLESIMIIFLKMQKLPKKSQGSIEQDQLVFLSRFLHNKWIYTKRHMENI